MTKTANIESHLLSGQPLTPLEALRLYGCMRLADVVHKLKKKGLLIDTRLIGEERYAEYRIIKPQGELFT